MSFVLLLVFFWYGMWFGMVYRRWSLPGLASFLAAQVLAGLVVVVVVTLTDDWNASGKFFGTTLTAPAAGRAGGGSGGARAGRVRHPAPGHRLTTGWPSG